MRRFLIQLHRYVGLVLGLPLALIGLTGSLLVFDHALDEFLTPETVTRIESRSSASLAAVLASASAAAPGEETPVRLHLPRQPGSSHVVRFPAPEGASGPLEVSVAPEDAKVLAVRTWGEYPMSWLYRLHYTLLAGTTGKYLVGVCGIGLLVICLSGIYLWWPRRRGGWVRALSVKRDRGTFRFAGDLHNLVGVLLLPVLLLVAFSGVNLVFPHVTKTLAGSVTTFDQRPKPQSGSGKIPLSIDEAVDIGRQLYPAAVLKRVFLPQGEAGAFELALKKPGEPWSSHAVTTVWVDQYSGKILAIWDADHIAFGSKLLAWQFPLHNGDALGLAGRWLILLTGTAPALLFGTGLLMWRQKYRKCATTQTIIKR